MKGGTIMENKDLVLESIEEQRQQNLSALEHSPGPWSIEDMGPAEKTVTLRDANDKVIGIICKGNAEGIGHVGTFAECQGNIAIIAAALEAAVIYEQAGEGANLCASLHASIEAMAAM
jgi:hypothetical protein